MSAERARRVVITVELPDRSRNTSAERIAMMAADVRDAAAQGRRKCEDYASKYTASGWALDEDGWELTVAGKTIAVIARLVREGNR